LSIKIAYNKVRTIQNTYYDNIFTKRFHVSRKDEILRVTGFRSDLYKKKVSALTKAQMIELLSALIEQINHIESEMAVMDTEGLNKVLPSIEIDDMPDYKLKFFYGNRKGTIALKQNINLLETKMKPRDNKGRFIMKYKPTEV